MTARMGQSSCLVETARFDRSRQIVMLFAHIEGDVLQRARNETNLVGRVGGDERGRRPAEVMQTHGFAELGTDGAGGWQSLDVPLRTITTLDRFGLVEPAAGGHTLRMLQVTELARAMGFGHEHRFPYGTRRARIRLLGNGVCPPVMEAAVSTMCVEPSRGANCGHLAVSR